MQLTVRLNGALVQEVGTSRVQVQIDDNGTVSDVIEYLCANYPQSTPTFKNAVAFASGSHLTPDTILSPNQQLALLIPYAGG